MNIAICNSKNWFNLSEKTSSQHRILNIRKKKELSLEMLKNFQPDFVFFPHWNWIVEKEVFNEFTCVVFHTAPLPYGRGGSPIQNLIKRGYTSSPVCALSMSDGIDSGPIYDQLDISLEGNLSEILIRLNKAVNLLIERLIKNLPEPKEQNGEVKIFKRLSHKDNEISMDASFEEFYNKIRMLDDSSYPNAYLKLENTIIEFSEISKVSDEIFCKVRIASKGTEE
tara:strand:- start:2312 stop:2986 length:675 start_codon:yes stop_codon:yes gene_type:complete